MKKTPLYDRHLKLGAKMIEFGGWMMPVQYEGILEEHEGVRNAAGLFDVSHMGEILIRGHEALQFIQKLVTNDISKAAAGQAVYSPMCNPEGGVVDDLLIYRLGEQEFLLVVNAANTEKDYRWITEHKEAGVHIEDVSYQYSLLALQGPKAESILKKLTDEPLEEIRYYRFRPDVEINGIKTLVSRSGYTGEDGFEIYVSPDKVEKLWDDLLEAGKEEGLKPAGLGARDTLRFEAALPLYGHELSEEISPLEAGLGRFVKLNKGEFIGRSALAAQDVQGVKRKLVGFEMTDRGIPRHGYDIYADGDKIGFVTTGSYSPTLRKNIGLGLVKAGYSETGTEIQVAVRNKNLKAVVVKTPFYKRK